MALLRGYSAVPGSARRVRTPSGEVISHRQYRNIAVRKGGWRSLSELETSQDWAKFRVKIRANNRDADVSYSSRNAADFAKVKRRREQRPGKLLGRDARGRPRWRKDPQLEPLGREMKDTPLGRLLSEMGVVDESDIWGQYA